LQPGAASKNKRFEGRQAKRMKVGYARVSTNDQNLGLQLDALRRACCDQIFREEGVSGVAANRPALDAALAAPEPGDVLVVWKLDRLGRSLAHLISLVSKLGARDVAFISLSEAIDTNCASGRLLFHVMGALAEFERSLISERTRAGIAAARDRGARIGRPTKFNWDDVRAAQAEFLAERREIAFLARELGLSVSTLRRPSGSCLLTTAIDCDRCDDRIYTEADLVTLSLAMTVDVCVVPITDIEHYLIGAPWAIADQVRWWKQSGPQMSIFSAISIASSTSIPR
jgi:DNA invertase Pin-like site-specific DNA recombinase